MTVGDYITMLIALVATRLLNSSLRILISNRETRLNKQADIQQITPIPPNVTVITSQTLSGLF